MALYWSKVMVKVCGMVFRRIAPRLILPTGQPCGSKTGCLYYNTDQKASGAESCGQPTGGVFSLGVRDDGTENVPISLDREIEAPVIIDAGLPEPSSRIELLGPKGRVAEISEEIGKLLAEEPLDLWRACDQVIGEWFG